MSGLSSSQFKYSINGIRRSIKWGLLQLVGFVRGWYLGRWRLGVEEGWVQLIIRWREQYIIDGGEKVYSGGSGLVELERGRMGLSIWEGQRCWLIYILQVWFFVRLLFWVYLDFFRFFDIGVGLRKFLNLGFRVLFIGQRLKINIFRIQVFWLYE